MNILSLCSHRVIVSLNQRDADMLFRAFTALKSSKEWKELNEQDSYEQRVKNYNYVNRQIKRYNRMKDGIKK